MIGIRGNRFMALLGLLAILSLTMGCTAGQLPTIRRDFSAALEEARQEGMALARDHMTGWLFVSFLVKSAMGADFKTKMPGEVITEWKNLDYLSLAPLTRKEDPAGAVTWEVDITNALVRNTPALKGWFDELEKDDITLTDLDQSQIAQMILGQYSGANARLSWNVTMKIVEIYVPNILTLVTKYAPFLL
jgi:hypothetical protein